MKEKKFTAGAISKTIIIRERNISSPTGVKKPKYSLLEMELNFNGTFPINSRLASKKLENVLEIINSIHRF